MERESAPLHTASHRFPPRYRMKESLHLMIGPVLHSGLSTWFVISTLFFSNKDFTVIFFQTLTLVGRSGGHAGDAAPAQHMAVRSGSQE